MVSVSVAFALLLGRFRGLPHPFRCHLLTVWLRQRETHAGRGQAGGARSRGWLLDRGLQQVEAVRLTGARPRNAGVWLHGEAVAAGTVMAADMSYRLGWIERDILDRTVRLLERAKLPIAAPAVRPGLGSRSAGSGSGSVSLPVTAPALAPCAQDVGPICPGRGWSGLHLGCAISAESQHWCYMAVGVHWAHVWHPTLAANRC